MDPRAVLDAIDSLAQLLTAEQMSESTASLTHPAVFDAACETYGGWDVALAAALQRALSERGGEEVEERPASSARYRPAAAPTRQPHPEAQRPVLATTDKGYLLSVPVAGMAAGASAAPVEMPVWP